MCPFSTGYARATREVVPVPVGGHNFPLFQGPVVISIYTATEENLAEKEVLENRTVFCHNEDQECGEWHPLLSGLSAWGALPESEMLLDEPDFEVKTLSDVNLHGVASTRYMSLIYPCKANHCQIHCPCSMCCDLLRTRRHPYGKLGWNSSICHQACNKVQCRDHKLLLRRDFNALTDHIQVLTNIPGQIRFASSRYPKKL